MKAEKSILLSSFGALDKDIQHLLKIKKKQGVKVTIYNSKKQKAKRKKTSGLYHRKILLVDQKQIFLGSANCTESSLNYQGNELLAFCHEGLIESILKDTSFIGKNAALYLLPQDKKKACFTLITAIRQAKDHIHLSMYALSNEQIIDEIIQAHRRGVKVCLYLDRSMMRNCRTKVSPLFEENIPIYTRALYGLLHHKSALIDDTYIFGSTNWSKSGFVKNEEILVFLYNLRSKDQYQILKSFKNIKYTCTEAKKNILKI